MFGVINEDDYWESVRERMEAQDPGPYRVWDSMFLDDLHEEIEGAYGYPVQDLFEGDLIDIVEKYQKICPEEAKYNSRYDSIEYVYMDRGA